MAYRGAKVSEDGICTITALILRTRRLACNHHKILGHKNKLPSFSNITKN
jgi:hypothetical protein